MLLYAGGKSSAQLHVVAPAVYCSRDFFGSLFFLIFQISRQNPAFFSRLPNRSMPRTRRRSSTCSCARCPSMPLRWTSSQILLLRLVPLCLLVRVEMSSCNSSAAYGRLCMHRHTHAWSSAGGGARQAPGRRGLYFPAALQKSQGQRGARSYISTGSHSLLRLLLPFWRIDSYD